MSNDGKFGNPPLPPPLQAVGPSTLTIAPGDRWVLLRIPLGSEGIETYTSDALPAEQAITLLCTATAGLAAQALQAKKPNRIHLPFVR